MFVYSLECWFNECHIYSRFIMHDIMLIQNKLFSKDTNVLTLPMLGTTAVIALLRYNSGIFVCEIENKF